MWDRGSGTALKNLKTIGFLSNTAGPDPLKNHKATKLPINVGPSSARQRNAILVAFRRQADNGPPIVVFESYLSSSTKKKKKTLSKLDASAKKKKNLDPRMFKISKPNSFQTLQNGIMYQTSAIADQYVVDIQLYACFRSSRAI